MSELEKSEHVDLSNEIKQVKEANNSINDNLKSTNQLIDALSNGSSGQLEAVNVLRDLPNLNKRLDTLRNYIKKELNRNLLAVSNEITDQLNKGQNTLSTIQSKLNTINRVINAGQDILNSGKKRIDTIQTALPAIENAYINAMRTAQAYFPTAKKDVAKAADFVRNDLPGLERELANVTQSVNQKYHLYLVVMIML